MLLGLKLFGKKINNYTTFIPLIKSSIMKSIGKFIRLFCQKLSW